MESEFPVSGDVTASVVVNQSNRFSQFNLLKQIRSWGTWLLVLGVIQMLTARSLGSPWGWMLIIVGLASFYFRSAAMFMVYAITVLWAAFSNSTSGSSGWIVFSLVQLVITVSIFRDFLRFRKTEMADFALEGQDPGITDIYQRAKKSFPIGGCLIGSLALAGLVSFFILIFLGVAISGENTLSTELKSVLTVIFSVSQQFAIVALGVSIGALAMKYQQKAFSIIGIITSAIALISHIAFRLLSL